MQSWYQSFLFIILLWQFNNRKPLHHSWGVWSDCFIRSTVCYQSFPPKPYVYFSSLLLYFDQEIFCVEECSRCTFVHFHREWWIATMHPENIHTVHSPTTYYPQFSLLSVFSCILLGPDVLSTLFADILSLCSSLNVRNHIPRLYRRLHILIFTILDSRWEDKRFWTTQ